MCMHVCAVHVYCMCVYVFMTFCISQNFKDKQLLVAKITSFVPKTVLIVMVSACMDVPCT